MLSRVLFSAIFLTLSITVRAELVDPVHLESGQIAGGPASYNSSITVFKGIPFAAPPVGDLRWKSPQSVEAWEGVRNASVFGNVCIQPQGQGRLNIAMLPDAPALSEDCLYLNVWSGANKVTEERPVMVYIYGGAFSEGAGSVPLYDGEALAKKGAVVVTLNYRLGAYGFFAHPELTKESENNASGNYGLMDILAALEWVQTNVSAFGGDRDNVTVFGQSAGAMAIASLVASPLSKTLFHRAISQSGAWMGLGMGVMNTRESAEIAGLNSANELNANTVAELRALSSEQVEANLRGTGMLVDGWVIPEDPSVTFAEGRQNSVDVLVGSNKDEGSFIPVGPNSEQWKAQVKNRWGNFSDDALKLYPANDDEVSALSSQYSFRDGTSWHMRLFADYQRRLGKQAWVFFFARNPPTEPGQRNLMATHAAEVPYVFNNIGEVPLYPDGSSSVLASESSADLALAELMSSYWVNFARSGSPNGDGLPHWPVYQNRDSQVMILDENPRSEVEVDIFKWNMFDSLYLQQLESY